MSIHDKVDSGLAAIYADYVTANRPGAPLRSSNIPRRISVFLHYRGDLAPIEALGFNTIRIEPAGAQGSLDLADLEKIAASPDVLHLAAGQEPTIQLDNSVPNIRGDVVCTRSGTGSSMTFSGTTGEGAAVGIIDTGIDFHHPFFMNGPNQTRIRRIWDMSLTADSKTSEMHPSGFDYGVEYTDAEINNVLSGKDGAVVRHLDTDGHGTHIASIAAGNGAPDHVYVGVAPMADIIVVKRLKLGGVTPAHKDGTPLSSDNLTADALSYILETAKTLDAGKPMPVVVNYSAGDNMGAHDGFSSLDDRLTAILAKAPPGQIMVVAAGNELKLKKHAVFEFTAAGTCTIPLTLFEKRRVKNVDTKNVAFEIYYSAPGTTVTAHPTFPGTPDNAGDFPLGRVVTGATFGPGNRLTYDMSHATANLPLTGTAGTATRNRIVCVIHPDTVTNLHTTSPAYTMRLTVSGPVSLHLWCQQFQDTRGDGYGFELPAALPVPGRADQHSILTSPGAAPGLIGVASYNSKVATKPGSDFSSWGPAVVYAGSPASSQSKPDIAAPGDGINAALGRTVWPRCLKDDVLFTMMDGTSMAAPHVTGVVALMLANDGTLTFDQALGRLKKGTQPPPGGTPDDKDKFGAGRIDAALAYAASDSLDGGG